MVRATNAPSSRRRRKKLLKRASGFWGDRKNHIRQSANAVMSSLSFNYRHRKQKKNDFRQLWIARIGVAAKLSDISYSKMMSGLKKAGCELNRKMLSEMAVRDMKSFSELAEVAKSALKS